MSGTRATVHGRDSQQAGYCQEQAGVTRVRQGPVSSNDRGRKGPQLPQMAETSARWRRPTAEKEQKQRRPVRPGLTRSLCEGRGLQPADPSDTGHLKKAAAPGGSAPSVAEQNRDPSFVA